MTIERTLRGIAGVFVLGSVALGYFHSPLWYFLTLFVGLNLFQSAFSDWCPMKSILRAAGLRPCDHHSRRTSAKQKNLVGMMVAIVFLWVALPQSPAVAQEVSAKEIVSRYYDAFYSQGFDLWAKISMDLIGKDGRKRSRQMVMIRKDFGSQGDQKYYIYFLEPGDVRRTSFLVWKYPSKDDERWIFIPAVDLVRRVAAEDKRSSFIGSDFTYEDISGRDVEADDHKLLKSETINGRDCHVIESIPRDKADYSKRISWVDKKSYLPVKEEYYDLQNDLYRVFTADEIKDKQISDLPNAVSNTSIATGSDTNTGNASSGKSKVFPTITKRTMQNMKTGHKTEVRFLEIKYDNGVEDGVFTERSLRTPPTKWIK